MWEPLTCRFDPPDQGHPNLDHPSPLFPTNGGKAYPALYLQRSESISSHECQPVRMLCGQSADKVRTPRGLMCAARVGGGWSDCSGEKAADTAPKLTHRFYFRPVKFVNVFC